MLFPSIPCPTILAGISDYIMFYADMTYDRSKTTVGGVSVNNTEIASVTQDGGAGELANAILRYLMMRLNKEGAVAKLIEFCCS